jgi:hypothetical protein
LRIVTCHACGKRLEVPDDYARRKIRCGCGVYCEVPESGKKTSPPAPGSKPVRGITEAEEIFAEGYRDESSPPIRNRSPVAEVVTQPSPVPAKSAPLVDIDEDSDGDPTYSFADKPVKKCPDCRKELAPQATLCPDCGFNLETGEKPPKVYAEVNRFWEAGWPLGRRVKIYLLCQVVVLPLIVLGAFFAGRWSVVLNGWFWFTVLLAFVLGTFDRLDLSRDRKGRIRLTKTWRYFFFARSPQVIPLREYEGVVTGTADKNGMDWIVCFFLLPLVLLPGILWWYYVIYEDTFQVALTKNHGFPELVLYRGSNRQRPREIATSLHEAAGVPYAE